jgi:4-coumarate--CoA ligase
VPPSPASFINTTTKDQITHPEIKHCSTYLSTALKSTHGLKEGDVISICAPNSIWYPVALFGVMRAGGVPALSSPGYTVDEMMHAFRTVGCKFVVTSLSALEVVRSTARKVGIKDKCIFILDGEVEGFGSIRSMIEEGRKMGEASQVMPYKLPQGRKNSEVCAVLCFSSGTTGLPKAVCSGVPP